MLRKGITPVVAIVLLIAVTVGAGGTIYSMVINTQSSVENPEEQLNLNPSSVEFESCWGTQADPNFSVRNTGPEAMNASEVPVRVNGTYLDYPGDYQIPEPIVDPQATFTLDVDIPEDMNEESQIGLIIEGEATTYQCRNLN